MVLWLACVVWRDSAVINSDVESKPRNEKSPDEGAFKIRGNQPKTANLSDYLH